ncbi:hypothetical protein L596_007093 [Steinernema carpocapsae]|uniref:Uncharacterized protein n=1 Tax=Steinernema carpocapsae TaxID=34508 RepID=A0A4U5P8M0_STECR|nr:hypothetical protein L596_007093 [Steinernema carpocapsae]
MKQRVSDRSTSHLMLQKSTNESVFSSLPTNANTLPFIKFIHTQTSSRSTIGNSKNKSKIHQSDNYTLVKYPFSTPRHIALSNCTYKSKQN